MRLTLNDICKCGSSNLMQKDLVGLDGEYPIFGASGKICNANFYKQDKPYVAIIKDGAGIGRTMLLPAKSSVIGTMQYLLPKDNILPEYLYYLISSMHLEKYSTGATIPHIYFRDYKNHEFEYCNIAKQKVMISKLRIIEMSITKNKAQIEMLDNLVKARFVEMFGNIHAESKWKKESWSELVTIQNGRDYKKIQVKTGGYPVYGTGGEIARASGYLCPENSIIIGRK